MADSDNKDSPYRYQSDPREESVRDIINPTFSDLRVDLLNLDREMEVLFNCSLINLDRDQIRKSYDALTTALKIQFDEKFEPFYRKLEAVIKSVSDQQDTTFKEVLGKIEIYRQQRAIHESTYRFKPNSLEYSN
jgi:hypothetical protein